ncbi:cation:proton antiporter domain-containing protein [Sutterella megalosphaeroides]|uniref:Efflux pump/antiporter n=1 Tax=Sutterella megalosphaeroides TaxID=2494234 RepID=A0A2Z6IAR5_9BURK|nr:cation:proton antiporter [Sutterella megalosphaeroides]BBF22990.1 efflux pump/antiporter [Sutterella megalosphaeroides]
MEHGLPLISTLVIAFSLALVFGFIAERFLKSPALVGYLLAGIACGQYTPGVFADPALAHQLSEIGVMLLMFGVGLHFSVKDLMSVKGIALPGAVLQMSIASILGMFVAHLFWDWSWGQALVFGMSLSCASTVVLLKALDVRGLLTSSDGRIAVGWLVVEDIATVLILVLLPPLAGILAPEAPGVSDAVATAGAAAASLSGEALLVEIGRTIVNVVAFVAVMMLVGRKALPWLMAQVARTGSRELFTLFVLAAALGVAYGAAEIFKVSFALGAFFAGMVMRESAFAHRAATESLPLQDAFAVLFFVGCGMLFDWHILFESPLEILAVLFIVLFGKAAAAFGLVVLLRYPLGTALTVSAALSQIGEFSFILVAQAMSLGLADQNTMNLIVGGAIISIALNPVMFAVAPRVGKYLTHRFSWAKAAALRDAPFEVLPEEVTTERLSGQTVLVADGPLGERFAHRLFEKGVELVVVTKDVDAAGRLSEAGLSVLQGDASEVRVLVLAHVATAGRVLLMDATPRGIRVLDSIRSVKADIPVTVVSDTEGVWADVKTENVRFLSIEEAAAERMTDAVLEARASGEEPGVPFVTSKPVATEEGEEAKNDGEKPASSEAPAGTEDSKGSESPAADESPRVPATGAVDPAESSKSVKPVKSSDEKDETARKEAKTEPKELKEP